MSDPQEIIFVTGKGGVGKSCVAAALALHEARAGRKVLLAELGERSFYSHYLGFDEASGASPALPGVSLARWDAMACLTEYIAGSTLLPTATSFMLGGALAQSALRTAPGLSELALLGKITASLRLAAYRHDFDVTVVDAYASGHFVALLRAPRGMAEAFPTGPMGRHCGGILAVLRDVAISRYVVTTLPEALPVAEALELCEQIAAEVGRTPRIVVNKLLPEACRREVVRRCGEPRWRNAGYLHAMHAAYARQSDARAHFAEAGYEPTCLPHCFEADASALIRALERQL